MHIRRIISHPRLWAVLLIFLLGRAELSGLEFSPTFSSGMVIQRDLPVTVRGKGRAHAEITVSLGSKVRTTRSDASGGWRVIFEAMPAGGPVEMIATDGESEVKLEDLLVGDVWLFSGQSNMQMGLAEVDGGIEEIHSLKPDVPIRLLSVPKAGADTPQDASGATWRRCTPDVLRTFSAVGCFFAKHLQSNSELESVPLGLIDSSFGGTAIEAWTPGGTLPDIAEDRISGSMFGIPPGHLFNRMIAPLCATPIKGVAWYQGEANAGAPDVYAKLLRNMILQWRRAWRQSDLPFLVVQLPAFEGRMGGLDFSWLREAEAEACRDTDNVWLAVTYDTTDGFDLHPREKEEIGRRLSLLARREVYRHDVVAHGPQFERAEFLDGSVVVRFDQPLITLKRAAVRGFALAGADGDFRYAEAEIDGANVVLKAAGIIEPRFVRFAWGAMPDANLVNTSGLPAVPFRTDDLPPDSTAFQPLPTVYRIETPVYSMETGRGGSIASLVVGGRQFLSNEHGGGTSVPGFFGPRNLAYTTVEGPRRLVLSDGGVTLSVSGADASMVWTFTNHGNDPVELQIALSSRVVVRTDGSSVVISRDGVQLGVTGVSILDTPNKLIARAEARSSSEIRWSMTVASDPQ